MLDLFKLVYRSLKPGLLPDIDGQVEQLVFVLVTIR